MPTSHEGENHGNSSKIVSSSPSKSRPGWGVVFRQDKPRPLCLAGGVGQACPAPLPPPATAASAAAPADRKPSKQQVQSSNSKLCSTSTLNLFARKDCWELNYTETFLNVNLKLDTENASFYTFFCLWQCFFLYRGWNPPLNTQYDQIKSHKSFMCKGQLKVKSDIIQMYSTPSGFKVESKGRESFSFSLIQRESRELLLPSPSLSPPPCAKTLRTTREPSPTPLPWKSIDFLEFRFNFVIHLIFSQPQIVHYFLKPLLNPFYRFRKQILQ